MFGGDNICHFLSNHQIHQNFPVYSIPTQNTCRCHCCFLKHQLDQVVKQFSFVGKNTNKEDYSKVILKCYRWGWLDDNCLVSLLLWVWWDLEHIIWSAQSLYVHMQSDCRVLRVCMYRQAVVCSEPPCWKHTTEPFTGIFLGQHDIGAILCRKCR